MAAGIAALLLVAMSACGGGSSSHAGSLRGYCQQLKTDWSTLAEASADATTVWMDSQTPGAVESQVAQELRPKAALYKHAANLATSLAARAPTSIKNDINSDSENARARFQAMSKGFSEAAEDKTNDLGNLDTSALDAGTTGCNFETGAGPNGTVATQFTSR